MSEVHYNYALMNQVAAEIQMGGVTAQGLLDDAISNEAQMMSHFHGGAADTAQQCLQVYKSAAMDMIEVVQRGAHSYHEGTNSMQTAEHAQIAYFPG